MEPMGRRFGLTIKTRRMMSVAPGSKLQIAQFKETSASPVLTGRWRLLLAVGRKIRVLEGKGLQVLDASVEYIDG